MIHLRSKFKWQRGQATTELIVALFVLIPLFFMSVYVFKYFDMKQSAIQASRYAAFERSWDPKKAIKSDAALEEEVQARFFSTRRHIAYQDRPGQLTDQDRVPLWRDLTQANLLTQFTDVKLQWDNSQSLTAGVANLPTSFGGSLLSLPDHRIFKAQVNVPVANVTHFDALSSLNLTLPAATAIGAGSWSSSGSTSGDQNTCDTVKRLVPTSWDLVGAGDLIRTVISTVMGIFERNDIELGIVKPDIVPEGSLRANGDLQTWTNVPVASQKNNATKCP